MTDLASTPHDGREFQLLTAVAVEASAEFCLAVFYLELVTVSSSGSIWAREILTELKVYKGQLPG